MEILNDKNQILESLDALDSRQAEKVLNYIKRIISPEKNDEGYRKFKQSAMQEIRNALGSNEESLIS